MKHHRNPSPASTTAPVGSEALSANDELFLLKLRYKSGRLINVEGRQPIPLTGLEASFQLHPKRVEAYVTVTSVGRTGVEMEALAGVSAALLNIWDMVKYLEKDESGNYPHTAIEEIRVIKKEKERN